MIRTSPWRFAWPDWSPPAAWAGASGQPSVQAAELMLGRAREQGR